MQRHQEEDPPEEGRQPRPRVRVVPRKAVERATVEPVQRREVQILVRSDS